jgi:hypothetical protein
LPVALPAPRAARNGPGANILAAGGHGPPEKNLTGYGRPWIKILAREAKKYKNYTKILIFFCYTENISV